MIYILILPLLAQLLYIPTGKAIDCHQCASWDSGACGDSWQDPESKKIYEFYDTEENADNVDGCDDRDTHCLKVKVILKLFDSGFILGEPRRSVSASRGCIRADDYAGSDKCWAIETASGMQLKCICATDECNTASGVLPNFLFTLLSAIGTYLLWRCL
ncbi:uncharacterized protein LOC128231451 [Mya arenaria]|uniref:uncharacterized protein LOC128231451 n=1 Tax=Mya arenaria TaxID=6604 RepID=UPI0022E1AA08|nr:uncharacterized protein LOC128231451 [Mya arenaria]